MNGKKWEPSWRDFSSYFVSKEVLCFTIDYFKYSLLSVFK